METSFLQIDRCKIEFVGIITIIILQVKAISGHWPLLEHPVGRTFNLKISSQLRDAPDIHRIPIVHMVKTNLLLENLGISEPSLGILNISNVDQLSLI